MIDLHCLKVAAEVTVLSTVLVGGSIGAVIGVSELYDRHPKLASAIGIGGMMVAIFVSAYLACVYGQ